jgi:hypothetical protein
MLKKIINPATGEFTLNSEFTVSHTTTVDQLLTHFAERKLEVNDFKNGHSNVNIRNLKIDEWYFILTFYFFNN